MKILVINFKDPVSGRLISWLKEQGHMVLEKNIKKEGLPQIIRETQPGAVILDARHTYNPVAQALSAIQELPPAHVFVLTDYTDPFLAGKFQEAGIQNYMTADQFMETVTLPLNEESDF